MSPWRTSTWQLLTRIAIRLLFHYPVFSDMVLDADSEARATVSPHRSVKVSSFPIEWWAHGQENQGYNILGASFLCTWQKVPKHTHSKHNACDLIHGASQWAALSCTLGLSACDRGRSKAEEWKESKGKCSASKTALNSCVKWMTGLQFTHLLNQLKTKNTNNQYPISCFKFPSLNPMMAKQTRVQNSRPIYPFFLCTLPSALGQVERDASWCTGCCRRPDLGEQLWKRSSIQGPTYCKTHALLFGGGGGNVYREYIKVTMLSFKK